jgi:hypothetical protein
LHLRFDAENVKLVVARQLLLLGDETTLEGGGQTDVQGALRAPLLAVVVGLFPPRVDSMPYRDNSVTIKKKTSA